MKRLKRHPKDGHVKHRIEFDMKVLASMYANDRADHEDISSISDSRKHLTSLLASFEFRSIDNGDTTYYLLFNCADGNLADFWKENDTMVGDQSQLPWMATQFSQLTGALNCIHNDRGRIRSERTWSNLYSPHSDIKPSNILYFNLPDGKKELHVVIRWQQNPSDITVVRSTSPGWLPHLHPRSFG